MQYLLPLGIVMALAGLVGLGICIVRAMRLRKSGRSQEELQPEFQKLVALNLGSLFLSTIGLMCVVMGVFLT